MYWLQKFYWLQNCNDYKIVMITKSTDYETLITKRTDYKNWFNFFNGNNK